MNSLGKHILDVIVPRGTKLPSTVKNVYAPHSEHQTRLLFEIYELYSSEDKKYYDVDEGSKTKYCFEHRFGKEVPKTTRIALTTTLTADGVLELTTNDFGASENSIQKHRIELRN